MSSCYLLIKNHSIAFQLPCLFEVAESVPAKMFAVFDGPMDQSKFSEDLPAEHAVLPLASQEQHLACLKETMFCWRVDGWAFGFLATK